MINGGIEHFVVDLAGVDFADAVDVADAAGVVDVTDVVIDTTAAVIIVAAVEDSEIQNDPSYLWELPTTVQYLYDLGT